MKNMFQLVVAVAAVLVTVSATAADARFSLSLSADKAQLLPGGSLALKATLRRQPGFNEAVKLAVSGLPAGVSAATVVIAAGSSEADIGLQADAAAPHSLPSSASVLATAGAASAAQPLTITVRGAAGAMDGSFGGGRVITPVDIGEDYVNALALQADGSIVVVGASATNRGTVVSLLRYQRDGSLDAGFGQRGKLVTAVGTKGNDSAAAVAFQPDGKIVVAGASDQGASGLDFALLRYLADGRLDSSFGNAGKLTIDFGGNTDRAWALLIQPDGKIVVGGESNSGNAASGVDFALVRVDADGVLDPSFGQGGKLVTALKSAAGSDVVRALALQTVAGQPMILAVGGEGDFLAARYTMAGALDPSFGSGGKLVGLFNASIGAARAIALLPGGEVVVAGHIGHRFAAAQLTAAGQLDKRFGNAGKFEFGALTNWNEATALVRQADGKLILGGWAYSGNSSSGDFAAIRLSADGRLDAGFGQGGVALTPMAAGNKNDLSHALVLQADERVPVVRAIQAGEASGSNHDVALLRLWL